MGSLRNGSCTGSGLTVSSDRRSETVFQSRFGTASVPFRDNGQSRFGTTDITAQTGRVVMTRNTVVAATMTRPRWAEARDMAEAELQQAVIDLCAKYGLYHCHPASLKGVPAGWPDSVVIGPHRVLWRELKTQQGRCSDKQRAVGKWLRQAGQSWQVWRPVDLLSGAIERELAELAAFQWELFTMERSA